MQTPNIPRSHGLSDLDLHRRTHGLFTLLIVSPPILENFMHRLKATSWHSAFKTTGSLLQNQYLQQAKTLVGFCTQLPDTRYHPFIKVYLAIRSLHIMEVPPDHLVGYLGLQRVVTISSKL